MGILLFLPFCFELYQKIVRFLNTMTNCLVSLLFVTCVRQLCSDSLKARYLVVAIFAHAQTFDGLVVVTRRLMHFFRIGKIGLGFQRFLEVSAHHLPHPPLKKISTKIPTDYQKKRIILAFISLKIWILRQKEHAERASVCKFQSQLFSRKFSPNIETS